MKIFTRVLGEGEILIFSLYIEIIFDNIHISKCQFSSLLYGTAFPDIKIH